MIDVIDVDEHVTLDDYAAYIFLKPGVQSLKQTARETRAALSDRTIWMINSTVRGGGVAEMMPKTVSMLRELGVDTRWMVIDGPVEDFFALTKRIHNMLHGAGDKRALTSEEKELYESTSRRFAREAGRLIAADDIVVVHDPQPLAVGALLKQELNVHLIWRCHIGLDRETPVTSAAWNFLEPWTQAYDHTVFSLKEYVPSFLEDRSEILPPAIDPLSHKNRELSINKFTGILTNASLVTSAQPVLTPPFHSPVERVQRDGSLATATQPEDIGLMFRPVVAQISRWDHLKGFAPLLRGFAHLKEKRRGRASSYTDRHRRRLDLVRLVLAGPDPRAVHDDPESQEVFDEIRDIWLQLDPEIQRDVAILSLPMDSRKCNALIVNVLQRCASVIVQNSLREGFGLTVSEAMWKRIPVLGSTAAGIRSQIEENVHGKLIHDPENLREVARMLDLMLQQPKKRDSWARNAQRRVNEKYLVLSQVKHWLEILSRCAGQPPATERALP